MYWDNCWFNNFNKNFFFNKTIFIGSILHFLFSDEVFDAYFFIKKKCIEGKQLYYFKKFFKKKQFKKQSLRPKRFVTEEDVEITTALTTPPQYRYNFTRLWFVKYNKYILISIFCFFSTKILKKNIFTKNNFELSYQTKIFGAFFRKKAGKNWRKNQFFYKDYLVF